MATILNTPGEPQRSKSAQVGNSASYLVSPGLNGSWVFRELGHVLGDTLRHFEQSRIVFLNIGCCLSTGDEPQNICLHPTHPRLKSQQLSSKTAIMRSGSRDFAGAGGIEWKATRMRGISEALGLGSGKK